MAHWGPPDKPARAFGRWLKRLLQKDPYQQWLYRELSKVKAEVRAGKDLETAIGWDWRFGLEVMKRGWKGPAAFVLGLNAYYYGRFAFDEKYVFRKMGECQSYQQLYYLVEKVELMRPGFREHLFATYEQWLLQASEQPMEALQNMDMTRFEDFADWIEKLKYDTERQKISTGKHSQLMEDIQRSGTPRNLPGYDSTVPLPSIEQINARK